jgi:methyl-accepting chemotaxis protein
LTIRNHFKLLTGVVIVSVLTISAVFASTLLNLTQLERERLILSKLGWAAAQFNAATNSLDSDQIDGARSRFDESWKLLDSSFTATSSIKELRKSGPELRKALKIINNMHGLALEAHDSIATEYDTLSADVKKYFYETRSTRIIMFYTNNYARAKYDFTEVYTHLDSFYTTIAGAASTLNTVSTTISEQGSVIDAEIVKKSNLGFAFALLFSIFLGVGIFLYARYTGNSIARRVRMVDDALVPIGEGRLTDLIPNVGNDEIGNIAGSINSLVGSWAKLISGTKDTAQTLREKGTSLSSHMEETSASILQINGRIADTRVRLEEHGRTVESTVSATAEIADNGKALREEIARERDVIESSSTSVEELLANVGSLSDTTGKVNGSAGELLELAERGREQIDSVSESIRGINQSSEKLMEAVKVIKDIAAQTNLLAMNAAIEAAHAGASGLGFAVVADEIRKLANQSAEQSKSISANLKESRASLSRVAGLSDAAQGSFYKILSQVRSVRELVGEVDTALEEQNAGSSELLKGIGELKTIAARLDGAGEAMGTATENIAASVRALQETTATVNANDEEMLIGTEEINRSVKAILTMTEENRDLIKALESEMARFVVE